MKAESDLQQLLTQLEPELDPECHVFVSCHEEDALPLLPVAKAVFRERENVSLILTAEQATAVGLAFSGLYRCISLGVHSSLQAVGLTAALSTALADQGISANVVAAYYHDHVFVPARDADRALSILRSLK